MGKLDKKVAIVTGATSGIGRETAILLSKEGASVVFTGRNKDAAEETSSLISKDGGKSLFIKHDVADENNWIEVIKTTKDHFGSLDLLVNNAGQFFLKPIMETSLDDFNQICSVYIYLSCHIVYNYFSFTQLESYFCFLDIHLIHFLKIAIHLSYIFEILYYFK